VLSVTGQAKAELRKLLTDHADHPEVVLRLTSSTAGQFGLIMDTEATGDQVIEDEGYKVLLLEPGLAANLKEHVLAFEDKNFVIVKGPLSAFNKSVVTFNGKEKKR
jgi:hypothetical protein